MGSSSVRSKVLGALAVATVPVWGPASVAWQLARAAARNWKPLAKVLGFLVAFVSVPMMSIAWLFAFGKEPGESESWSVPWLVVAIAITVPWTVVFIGVMAFAAWKIACAAYRRGAELAGGDGVHPAHDGPGDGASSDGGKPADDLV